MHQFELVDPVDKTSVNRFSFLQKLTIFCPTLLVQQVKFLTWFYSKVHSDIYIINLSSINYKTDKFLSLAMECMTCVMMCKD